MWIILTLAMVGAGVAAAYRPWVWGTLATGAVAIAVGNWQRGAYEDSGGELGFSILLVAVILLPAAVGTAGASWARNRANSQTERFEPEL